MLIVESGAFYPSLENAFLKRVLELKGDPFAPIAVVTPSGRLLERLQRRLAAAGPGFINIHFHSFSSLAERVVAQEGGLPKPVLSDPLFFDTLVKFIIKSDRPFRGFDDMAIPDGFPMAVRATLRDLMDSGASADIVEAVKEGFLGRDVDIGSLKQLLQLYRLYLDKLETLPVFPRLALLKKAIQSAPSSTYLKGFKEILFYGFYDATGVQTDFFQAVVKHHPSRLYFPYDSTNPAYAFARRFRDTHLQPVMQEEMVWTEDTAPVVPTHQVLNVSGLRDEAALIARQLRQIHDEEKIPFSDMAVVARSRDRLEAELPRALEEWRIPYFSSNEKHLSERPLYRTLIDVLEGKMEAEWPAKASWETHNKLAVETLRATPYWSDVEDTLEQMEPFSHLSKNVSKDDYFEALKERLARQIIPREGQTQKGVTLLHAEAARGLSFRVMVLAGVEEKAFPRIIREDPFLRDDARMALSNTLGYKISQKMTAHEEEQLLFELLTQAAQEKLIFTYQRSDDDGAVVGPSPFLRAWAEKQGKTLADIAVAVPRSYREKLKASNPASSSLRDLVTACLLSEKEAAALALAESQAGALSLGPSLNVQQALQSFSEPGPYDGEVGEQKPTRLSATSMETFGHCPFQYFTKHVLGIDPIEEEVTPDRVPPRLKGSLVHLFFETFFKEVTEEGTEPPPVKIPEKTFKKVFDIVFNEAAAKEAAVWPVIWQAFVVAIKSQLHELLGIDLKSLAEEGFRPAYFEALATAKLPAPLDGIEWIGKMDRIDVSAEAARVIDYKSGGSPKESIINMNLKGLRSQPALYLLLCDQFLKEKKRPLAGASFAYRYLKTPEMSDELSWDDWNKYQKQIFETMRVQLTALRAGHYPIIPGDYCDWCGLASVCRKNDSLSVYRARQGAAQLLALRAKRK